MSAALDKARRLLAEALETAPERIADGASIHTIEAWDSLAHLRLIQAIERRLGRELPPEAMIAVESLADVARLLEAAP